MANQNNAPLSVDQQDEDCSTREAADLLGLAVRSVQLMVDRGDLQAWKTPGGHRRIARQSIFDWQQSQTRVVRAKSAGAAPSPQLPARPQTARQQILLIEDSTHYQNLVRLLVGQHHPDATLHVADDGIAGLALAGRLEPDVLIVDILLPGIDGATLITSLRSHPQFRHSALVVITSLDEQQRQPYAFALSGLPVVHKSRLVVELPGLLAAALAARASAP